MAVSAEKIVGSLIRILLVIGLVTVIVVVVQSCQQPKLITPGVSEFAKGPLTRMQQLEPAPAQPGITYKTTDGREMTLADYRGKVILVNVWATWCPPCVREMPLLDELQDMRGDDDFEVVTLSMDRIPEDAAEFFERNEITNLTPWHDATYSTSAKVAAPGLPVSIFYDKKGREVGRISGEIDWTSSYVIDLIDYLSEEL